MERTYNKREVSIVDAFNEMGTGDVTHLSQKHYKANTIRNRASLINNYLGKTYTDKIFVTETKVKPGYVTLRKRGK